MFYGLLDPHTLFIFTDPGSRSFHQQANQKEINKKTLRKKNFIDGILSATNKKAGSASRAGSGSVSQWYGSAKPDPYQNVTAQQHWILVFEGRNSEQNLEIKKKIPGFLQK